MSDAFVDVSWQGLDVGRRLKMHGVRAASAYIDLLTPMPVGSRLGIRTDDGEDLEVVVVRVHEQVGGSSESPGMEVEPRAASSSSPWWQANSPKVSVAGPVLSTVGHPELPAEPEPPTAARHTIEMSPGQMAELLGAVASIESDSQGSPVADGGERTEVMPALLQEVVAGTELEVPAMAADSDNLIDDGRRTAVMSAADVSAIVEAVDSEDDGGANSAAASSGAAESGALARGKSKRQPRGKRRGR